MLLYWNSHSPNVTEVSTRGTHSISISGVLTGCEMSNIKLYQQPSGSLPEIDLYLARIDGNMAEYLSTQDFGVMNEVFGNTIFGNILLEMN